jgi:hypothetical protein
MEPWSEGMSLQASVSHKEAGREMTRKTELDQVWGELVEAHIRGDEARARALVSRLGAQPRKAGALLEDMLSSPDARVRQAAVFGLGELGGAASARCLELRLALEEARGDYDGASVVEAITQALGRIEETSARATLAHRLERLAASRPDPVDVNVVACALWRRRHPDLLPAVRRSLERLALPAPNALHGLLLLLEKPPEELRAWARNPSVPVEHKTEVLTVLEAELPQALVPTLPSFISAAHALAEPAVRQVGPAAYYCECLLSLLLLHREWLVPSLPEEALEELHVMARALVAALSPNCSLRATVLLKSIGSPEDAAIIEAHRPEEPVGAKVFHDAARTLRSRQKS